MKMITGSPALPHTGKWMGFRRPCSCIAARLDGPFPGFKENEVNFLTGGWGPLRGEFGTDGVSPSGGMGSARLFLGRVLALGVERAPGGDWGLTESVPPGGGLCPSVFGARVFGWGVEGALGRSVFSSWIDEVRLACRTRAADPSEMESSGIRGRWRG